MSVAVAKKKETHLFHAQHNDNPAVSPLQIIHAVTMTRARESLRRFLVASLPLLTLCFDQHTTHRVTHAPHVALLPPGYDDAADRLFTQHFKQMTDAAFAGRFTNVSVMGAHFDVIDVNGWWTSINTPHTPPTWEPDTFRRFFQYITPHTTLVDFGTWIGPTLLFGATRAGRVFGIEGDPAAYAEVLANVQVNAPVFKNVHLQPGCVATTEERRTMKSAAAGNSCSGLKQVGCGTPSVEWQVQCYTLPFLFHEWGIGLDSATFIKIDVESYECDLLPSLAAWLQSAAVKPTLHVAMHSQVERCTDAQYKAIDALTQSYAYAACNGTVSRHGLDVGGACSVGELLLSDVLPPVV